LTAHTATPNAVMPQEGLSGPPAANRHRLQDERPAITHHFSVGGYEGYLTVGLYPNGQPGEIFIRMAKAGSTIAGLMESFGTVVSVALQHGVPLKVLCDKLSHTRFEPSGWTGSEELGYAKSIMDYLSGGSHCVSCRVTSTRYSLRPRRRARLLLWSRTWVPPMSSETCSVPLRRETCHSAPLVARS
jgi:hypothetical protein